MTSQSAGAQWLRNPTSSFARPRHQPPSQPTPRSVPSQITVDLVGRSFSKSTTEPAVKRQRLDGRGRAVLPNVYGDGSDYSRRINAAGNAEDDISADASAQGSPLQTSGSTSEFDQAEVYTRTQPILPVRPGRNPHWYHMSAEAPGKTGVRESVQIRPYVAEPPSSAPRYQEDGMPNLKLIDSPG